MLQSVLKGQLQRAMDENAAMMDRVAVLESQQQLHASPERWNRTAASDGHGNEIGNCHVVGFLVI